MFTNNEIDFSEDKTNLLINVTEKLNDILTKANFFVYTSLLENIKNAAISKNEDEFIELVGNNALFGGAGALWEIYIENEYKRIEFNRLFCSYIDNLKLMGINNNRINQIRQTLPQLL